MTRIVQASHIGDVIANIPTMLGYQPERSIVILPMENKRTVGAMRFDLPDELDPRMVRTMIGNAIRVPLSTGFMVFVYGDQPSVTYLQDLNLFNGVAEECGYHMLDGAVIGSDGFRGDAETVLPLPETEALPKLQLEKPVTSIPILEAIASANWPDDPLEDLVHFAETIAHGELAPGDWPRLYLILNLPAARDISIVQWAADRGEEAYAAQVASHAHGTEYPTDLARVMWGDAPRPRPEVLEHVLKHVVQVCGMDDSTGGAWATAAWLSWALGRSSHAAQYAAWALEAEPDHGLAKIVKTFTDLGHLPDWAFHKA